MIPEQRVMRVMRITWMDGLAEEYPFTNWETSEGELYLYVECGNPGVRTWRKQERWIPIKNIRIRAVV